MKLFVGLGLVATLPVLGFILVHLMELAFSNQISTCVLGAASFAMVFGSSVWLCWGLWFFVEGNWLGRRVESELERLVLPR